MSLAQDLETSEDILEDVIFPPGDLYSDEPPLETELHLRQIMLLLQCLESWQVLGFVASTQPTARAIALE